MKTKRFLVAALMATSAYAIPFTAFQYDSPIRVMAQDKQFTLEDLNFGGHNYRNMVPKSQYHTWWGDKLVRLDVEECYLVDKKTGREQMLLDTAQVNGIIRSAGRDELGVLRHMYNISFPEASKTLVMVNTGRGNLLIDWKTRQVLWAGKQPEGARVLDFCQASKAAAVLKGENLYVVDNEGVERQLSSDGSRSIVYGQLSLIHI